MRRTVVLLCVMLGAAAPLAALDAYPKTTLAEDGTATWCGYCPDAYAGLDVVRSQYDYGEFLSARYDATSGGLGTAETDAALAYYGINAFPTVVFNGLTKVVGVGAGTLRVVRTCRSSAAPTSSRRRSGSRSATSVRPAATSPHPSRSC